MSIKKIYAIFDELQLDAVEKSIELYGVYGITNHPVKASGFYRNVHKKSHLIKHVEIEIYTSELNVNKIANVLMRAANVGIGSEGFLTISSIDQLFWIDKQLPIAPAEFECIEEPQE